MPSKPSLPACFRIEFAIAGVVAVELKAELVGDQRLEQRLPLDERQPQGILAVKVEEVEGVVDEPRAAFAVGCSLGAGEAGQFGVIDAAEFAVEIGGLHVQVGDEFPLGTIQRKRLDEMKLERDRMNKNHARDMSELVERHRKELDDLDQWVAKRERR